MTASASLCWIAWKEPMGRQKWMELILRPGSGQVWGDADPSASLRTGYHRELVAQKLEV